MSGDGIAVIEQGLSLGGGYLQQFGINSNTSANSFIKCLYKKKVLTSTLLSFRKVLNKLKPSSLKKNRPSNKNLNTWTWVSKKEWTLMKKIRKRKRNLLPSPLPQNLWLFNLSRISILTPISLRRWRSLGKRWCPYPWWDIWWTTLEITYFNT